MSQADLVRACACQKSNKPALSRHFCFLPRKRCYLLSPAKHRKILRPLGGSGTHGCLGFGTKKNENETQTTSNQFKARATKDSSENPTTSRSDARSEHDPF